MNERAGVNGSQKRLHYLDRLQVLAIMGVFLFHAVHPLMIWPTGTLKTRYQVSWPLFTSVFSISGECRYSF